MSGNPQWYIFVHDSQYGPVTLATLQQWISEGRLLADDWVWDFVGESWKPAKLFPELRDSLGQAKPPPVFDASIPTEEQLAGTKVFFKSFRENRDGRQYIRISTCLAMSYQELNPFDGSLVSKPAKTSVENISPGGLAFEVYDKRIQPKRKLRMEITIPGREKPAVITGEVTRVIAYQHHRFLIGVGFRETNQADQDALFAFLRRQLDG